MTDRELRKLSREELLEMMLAMSRELESKEAIIAELEKKLEDRTILLQEAGSIAEAAVKINALFEAAQRTADDYLAGVRAMTDVKNV